MDSEFARLLLESEQKFTKALVETDYNALLFLTHPQAVFRTESGEIFHGIINLHKNYSSIIKIQSVKLLDRQVVFHGNHAVVVSSESRVGLLNDILVQAEYTITRFWKCFPKKCIVIGGCIINKNRQN